MLTCDAPGPEPALTPLGHDPEDLQLIGHVMKVLNDAEARGFVTVHRTWGAPMGDDHVALENGLCWCGPVVFRAEDNTNPLAALQTLKSLLRPN